MAQFKYKEGERVGSDGTVTLTIGDKKNPILKVEGIVPEVTIIETTDERAIRALRSDSKYYEVV